MQDLRCSDDSSTEDSSCHPSVTSPSDVITHVSDDTTVGSDGESQSQQTMTSMTSRHVTLNPNLKSPSRSASSSLHVTTPSPSDLTSNFRQTSPATRSSGSYLGNARTQTNVVDGAAEDRAERMDCSVQDLEKVLNQVEASERQAGRKY